MRVNDLANVDEQRGIVVIPKSRPAAFDAGDRRTVAKDIRIGRGAIEGANLPGAIEAGWRKDDETVEIK